MSTHPKTVINYCMKCGSTHFNFQEKSNSFLCADCGFHFFINCAGACALLIVDSQNRVLLCRRAYDPSKGKLDLPGGFVDPMERVEDAARREVMEELGLKVTELNYLTSFPNEYVFAGYSVFTLDLAFVCKVKSFDGLRAMDDVAAIEFHDPRLVKEDDICFPSIYKIVKAYADSME